MRTKRGLFVSALVFGLMINAGCKKEASPNIDCTQPTSDLRTVKELIIGKWDWTYEDRVNRIRRQRERKTPATEGMTRQYQFYRNGDLKVYRNDTLLSVEQFRVTTLDELTHYPPDSQAVIIILSSNPSAVDHSWAPVRACRDSLKLNFDFYSDIKGSQTWGRVTPLL